MRDFEIVLPRRVVPQPQPHLVPGGDCGACVLAGVLGISVERVYAELREEVSSIQTHEMQRILRVIHGRLAEATIDEPALWVPWHSSTGFRAFGIPAWHASRPWFNQLRMALSAGYYGIACVNHARAGIYGHGVDHWVALVGARTRKRDLGGGAATWDDEVLVSCSSKATPDEEWVEASDFLKHRGGFDTLFVRPA